MPGEGAGGRRPDLDLERRVIRDAMDRLLAGRPLRASGRDLLTVKALAIEAGVDRSALYQKHPDLRDEFRERIAAHGAIPDALAPLLAENAASRARIRDLVEQAADAQETIRRLERVIQVLTLENDRLRGSSGPQLRIVTSPREGS